MKVSAREFKDLASHVRDLGSSLTSAHESEKRSEANRLVRALQLLNEAEPKRASLDLQEKRSDSLRIAQAALSRHFPDERLVLKRFIGGTLEGLLCWELTSAKFSSGQVVDYPVGGSPYRVELVTKL